MRRWFGRVSLLLTAILVSSFLATSASASAVAPLELVVTNDGGVVTVSVQSTSVISQIAGYEFALSWNNSALTLSSITKGNAATEIGSFIGNVSSGKISGASDGNVQLAVGSVFATYTFSTNGSAVPCAFTLKANVAYDEDLNDLDWVGAIISGGLGEPSEPSNLGAAPLELVVTNDGDVVTVSVQSTSVVPQIAGYEFALSWDNSALTLSSITKGSAATEIGSFTGNTTSGKISGASDGNVQLAAGSAFATYTFASSGSALPCTFTLTINVAYDENLNDLDWVGKSVSDALTEELPDERITFGSITHSGDKIIAVITCSEEDVTIICATYGSGGQMLQAQAESVLHDGNAHTYQFTLNSSVEEVRLFAVDSGFRPLCAQKIPQY